MNNKPNVKFITLGCKVNQYETQGMREILKKAGAESVSLQEPPADVVIVNTCTVTAEADKENRYWIRRARRENPNAKIIVTGCGVERNRADYESMKEVDTVLRNHEKAEIGCHLFTGHGDAETRGHGERNIVTASPRHRVSASDVFSLAISETEGAGRAFVKIQDGCNHACSFCKVVLVRGRSRSRELKEIVQEAVRLRDSGYRELVFAGIQLGAYGLDIDTEMRRHGDAEKKISLRHRVALSPRLEDVLAACSQIEGIERLRLSSIEPTDISPSLIEAMKRIPKCCPQIHIPLQSGDDEILQRMNRRYDRSFYRDLIVRLRAAWPDFCLTLDVMAGFPGEEERHFENTVELIREIQPLKCHVFPYSRREGTRAAKFSEVPPAVIRERVKRLIAEAQEMSVKVRQPYLGKTVPILTESFKDKSGLLQGLAPNYLKVYFPGFKDQIGQIVPVKLISLHEDGFLGARAES